jgi:sulfatase modifying factor 1
VEASSLQRMRVVLLSGLFIACSSPSSENHAGTPATSMTPPITDRGVPDAAVPPKKVNETQAGGSGGALGTSGLSGFAPSVGCVQPPVARSCRDGLCSVPAGCFVMGTPRDARSAAAVSNREVEVNLTHAFVIGQTEVTREQWFAMGLPEPAVDWRTTGSSDQNVPPEGYASCLEPNCPVVWVNFEDATAYANLRSEAEGLKPCYLLAGCVRTPGDNMRCASVRVDAPNPYECEGYRLPTEAEWEYATRAGTRTDYYSGNMNPDPEADSNCALDENLDHIGWYCGNSHAPSRKEGGRPHPVAQKEPNGFGIYDTSGNAAEWTNDIHNPAGYGAGPLQDPVGGVIDPSDLTPSKHPVYDSPLEADGFPGYRERRGGTFDLWSVLAASGKRMYGYASAQHTGFRVVRTSDAPRMEPPQ